MEEEEYLRKAFGFFDPSFRPYTKKDRHIFVETVDRLMHPVKGFDLDEFESLSNMLGSIRPHEYTIICGSTGSGKTTFCANLSAIFAKQGIRQYIASVETGPHDFMARVMSALSRRNLNTGRAVSEKIMAEFTKQYAGLFKTGKSDYTLYESKIGVEELIMEMAYHYYHDNIQVAFIDNLNFFLDTSSLHASDQYKEMDRVTHSLVQFVKTLPIHIFMVMHPRKTMSGRVDSEFDLKGSSSAAQEAHNILLWNRVHSDIEAKYNTTEFDREMKIVKNRRLGIHVGRRVIFECLDGVCYREKYIL